jgi:DNA gyrase/topoisomerase IV subunit A
MLKKRVNVVTPVTTRIEASATKSEALTNWVPSSMAASGSQAGEFNLLRMVQDHAPRKIETITKEIAELKTRINTLESELSAYERLVEAAKTSF